MSKASLTNKVSEVIIFQFWAFTLYYKSFKYMVNHSRQVLSKKIGYITQPNPYTYRPPSPASRILSVVGFKKYLQGKFFDEEAILDELSEKLREVSCALDILQTHGRQWWWRWWKWWWWGGELGGGCWRWLLFLLCRMWSTSTVELSLPLFLSSTMRIPSLCLRCPDSIEWLFWAPNILKYMLYAWCTPDSLRHIHICFPYCPLFIASVSFVPPLVTKRNEASIIF